MIRPIPFAGWEMLIMRVLFAAILYQAFPQQIGFDAQPAPLGLARYFDLAWLGNYETFVWIRRVFNVALIVYATGFGLPVVLPIIAAAFAFSGGLLSSQGYVGHSHQIVALIALVQACWYCPTFLVGSGISLVALWPMRELSTGPKLLVIVLAFAAGWFVWRWMRKRFARRGRSFDRLESERVSVFLAQQTIVAVYVVSGLSKVIKSGFFGWISDARYFPIQIVKNQMYDYYNTLETHGVAVVAGNGVGAALSRFFETLPDTTQTLMISAPWVASMVLGAGLLLELFTWTALLSRGAAAIVGILIVAFHFLNGLIMDLSFPLNKMVVTVYFIQIPFWVVWGFHRFVKKRRDPVSVPVQGTFSERLRKSLTNCIPLIVLTVLLLTLKENYPFSHFPMYSSFSKNTYYVYVEDKNGDPVPIGRLSSLSTYSLRKIYNRRLKELQKEYREADPEYRKRQSEMTLEETEAAAEVALRSLVLNWSNPDSPEFAQLRPLQLCKVDLFLENGKIRERIYRYRETDILEEAPVAPE